MRELIKPALALFAALTLLTGVAYPLLVTGIAQVAFPAQANGSLITAEGNYTSSAAEATGSALIGQSFTNPAYFWSRPSATTPLPYNAASSSGSNLGPLNPSLLDSVRERVAQVGSLGQAAEKVPVDLVTASGSGLDPHISPAAAQYQVARVAAARNVTAEQVSSLVKQFTEGRTFGFLGEPRVNVLELNLALDKQFGRPLEVEAQNK
jgi:potassium-transporting ATPase KdpC subunit